jgi:hypothetical protein
MAIRRSKAKATHRIAAPYRRAVASFLRDVGETGCFGSAKINSCGPQSPNGFVRMVPPTPRRLKNCEFATALAERDGDDERL